MTYNPTAAWDRSELARLRKENADLTQELATVRDTLKEDREYHELRSQALNRTGEDNDRLRAQLARVEDLAKRWDNNGLAGLARVLRSTLADKEPTP